MNHTYSTEFCEPCDSAYRSYACMIAPPDNEDVNQTNPHPEQLSACCNAPVVFVKGNAWDVPPESISRGSTYGYGCTACKKACSPLSSTDSPETYATGADPEGTELADILDEMFEPNADDETPEGSIRNYRTLVLPDSAFQGRQDKAKAAILQWHTTLTEQAVDAAVAEARSKDPFKCEFGHEVYGHKTAEGWCCACEADIAFLESALHQQQTNSQLRLEGKQ